MAALAQVWPRQWNWVTETYESREPEQLSLDLLEPGEDLDHDVVTLLTTENGSQLYVSGFGVFLGKKSERVTVKYKGKICAEVPFVKVQEIVVGSRGVSLSSELLEQACDRGIRLSFLSSGGRPFALLTSPLLTATVETRKAQFLAIESAVGVEIARYVVAGKIRNQEKLLRYFARNRTDDHKPILMKAAAAMKEIRRKVLAYETASLAEGRGGLMGFEGVAGRLYWQQWVHLVPDSLEFGGRRHAGASDAVNACLNYGYGILTAHVWGAVMNAGLEPFAGFLHLDRSGKPSLALDLVEEFRQPVVDRAVFGWILRGGRPEVGANGMLNAATKEEVAARVLGRMNTTELHRGREHQVRSIIQMQARLCASAVRGMRQYRPFSFKW